MQHGGEQRGAVRNGRLCWCLRVRSVLDRVGDRVLSNLSCFSQRGRGRASCKGSGLPTISEEINSGVGFIKKHLQFSCSVVSNSL